MDLPNDSAFWLSKEADFPDYLPEISLQKHPRFLICRDADSKDVTVLNGGQSCGFEPRHTE